MSWVRFPSPAPGSPQARGFPQIAQSPPTAPGIDLIDLARPVFGFDWRPRAGYFVGKREPLPGGHMDQGSARRTRWSPWYLLFVIQFVAVLWPPFYNKIEPSWIGIPFFYWYQLLWVIVGAVLTAVVYFATDD
jgi:Protein of unknown function (DUF3311)